MFSRSTFRGLIAINLCCAAVTAPVMVYSVVYVDTELDLAPAPAPARRLWCPDHCAPQFFADGRPLHHTPVDGIGRGGHRLRALLATTTAHLAGLTYPVARGLVRHRYRDIPDEHVRPPGLIADYTDAGSAADVFTAQFSASHAAFLITYPLAGVTATHGGPAPRPC